MSCEKSCKTHLLQAVGYKGIFINCMISPEMEHPQLDLLCHYALRVWDRSHDVSWHLCGNSHSNLPPVENRLDVGGDVWDLAPISSKAVGRELMKS